MRRLILIPLLLGALLLSGCGRGADVSRYTVDYGESAVYTEEERARAVTAVVERFREWDGCVLHTVSYTDDALSTGYLDNCRERQPEADFTASIVFDLTFRSPKEGGGSWEPDCAYEWSMILAKSDGGEWTPVDWGVI